MKISSLLNEEQKPNQGTVNQLPVDRDLIYRAKNKYPGYSSEQAMILLIADEMASQEQTDANQNKLIDTQKRENERLRSVVNDLGQELQNFEQQSVETDKEVDRLKQLSGMLTTGSAGTQQQAKVSADELEKIQKDLETLKTKPGMDPKVYNELNSQLKTLQTNKSTDKEDVNKLQNIVKDIENDASVNFQSVAKQLYQTKLRLADKEQRFKEYKTSFKDYKKSTSDKLEKFGTEMNKELEISRRLRAGIMQDAEDIQQDASDIKTMKVEISQSLDFINDHLEKLSATGQPTKSQSSQPSIPWLNDEIKNQSGQAKNPNQPTAPNQLNIQENIIYREESYKLGKVNSPTYDNNDSYVQSYIDFTFPNPRYSKKYNDWAVDHLPKLFPYFTSTYKNELSKNPYTEKQILDTLTKYLPSLYNLGDEHTPLTKEQVLKWMSQVKLKLWELPIQQEMFNESLDKTYARMLDDIISLAYIKKG
jgi:chromosome segregation ATPase